MTTSNGDEPNTRRTKECNVTKATRFWMVTLAAVMSASVVAQEKPAPAAPKAAPPPPVSIPMKVTLVLSRFQAEKKLSSVPYVLSVIANDNLGGASVRMGVKIPVANGQMYSYQDVGTNIDCRASTVSDNLYKLSVTLNDSSIYYPDRQRSDSPGVIPQAGSAPPALRSFTSNFSMHLRDGQTSQYTTATDQVSGEVLKIDATINVQK
jgi:hypothetical protein